MIQNNSNNHIHSDRKKRHSFPALLFTAGDVRVRLQIPPTYMPNMVTVRICDIINPTCQDCGKGICY